MLVAVECEAMLPIELLQQLRVGLQLAVMHRDHLAVIAIHGPIAELQQLAHQDPGGARRDDVLIHLQQQITLKLVIGLFGLGVQHDRDFMLDKVRQLQVVLRFHGDADV